jgi:hypothetical protein
MQQATKKIYVQFTILEKIQAHVANILKFRRIRRNNLLRIG